LIIELVEVAIDPVLAELVHLRAVATICCSSTKKRALRLSLRLTPLLGKRLSLPLWLRLSLPLRLGLELASLLRLEVRAARRL
jgi:hypothetical protein